MSCPAQTDDIRTTVTAALDKAAMAVPDYPESNERHGICVSVRDWTSLLNAYVLIRLLRLHECSLPVELWHPNEMRLDVAIVKMLSPLGVRFRAGTRADRLSHLDALLHSDFREVLALNARNFPVRCPHYLFEEKSFRMAGALVWYDRRSWDSEIHQIIGLPHGCGPKPTFAQLLIDRRQCWEPLHLSHAIWRNEEPFAGIVPSEIDACLVGWHQFGQTFAHCPTLPDFLVSNSTDENARVICHFDLQGELLFQQRSPEARFRLFGSVPWIPGTLFEGECREFLKELRQFRTQPFTAPRTSNGAQRLALHEDLLRSKWLLRFGASSTLPECTTNNEAPCESRELRFLGDGTFGNYSLPDLAYWKLQQTESEVRLHLLAEDGEVFADLGLNDGAWNGQKAGSVEQPLISMAKLEVAFPGGRHSTGNVSTDIIRRQITERFGPTLATTNTSDSIEDHIVSVYACAAVASAGVPVVFHTPFASWLDRIAQPDLQITEEDPVASSESGVSLLDLNANQAHRTRFGVSLARWQGSLIHEELAPRRPDTVRNAIATKRLDFHRYVVVAPCSANPSESWPTAHWVRLIHLLRESGFDLLAVGSPDQDESLEEICAGTSTFWATNDDPDWLSDVLLGASALVSVNNAVAHFSGLLAVPTLVLHAQHESEFLWDCTTVNGLTPQVNCAFCRLRPEQGYRPGCEQACSALYTISPEAVVEKLRALPDRTANNPALVATNELYAQDRQNSRGRSIGHQPAGAD